MNIEAINEVVAGLVDYLRASKAGELKVGNIRTVTARCPAGAVSCALKGAINETRITLVLSMDADTCLKLGSIVVQRELKAVKDGVEALRLFAQKLADSLKRGMGKKGFVVSFAKPSVYDGEESDTPDLSEHPFLTVPLYASFGKIMTEVTTISI